MYGLFTYIWLIFMVDVRKYTKHGSYGSWTIYFHEHKKKTYRPCNAICTREGGYNFARDLDHIHGVVTSGNKKPDKVTPGSAPQQRPTSEHSQNSYICEHKP